MTTEQVNIVFYNYTGFRVGRWTSIFWKTSPIKQTIVCTLVFVVLFFLSSIFDKTLTLSEENIGLIEHPTIWGFLLLQIISPFFIKKSILQFLSFLKGNDIIDPQKQLNDYLELFQKQLSLKMNFSKFTYTIIVVTGILCFAWNSFQNQYPIKFLGVDFWDSFEHPFGYWISRVYKFYLWVFFFPALIHIHISILFVMNKLLKDAEKEKFFILKPYNQDEHGGVGIIIKIAIIPPIPILLVTTMSVLGTFFVHGQTGVTPLIGMCILSFLFFLIYFIPASQLRRIIKAEKKRQLDEIAEKQNRLYFELVKKDKIEQDFNGVETLNSLITVFKQVKSISPWPYWRFILKIIGLLNIPLAISIIKNLWPLAFRVFQR